MGMQRPGNTELHEAIPENHGGLFLEKIVLRTAPASQCPVFMKRSEATRQHTLGIFTQQLMFYSHRISQGNL
jgi:hypothetical protein